MVREIKVVLDNPTNLTTGNYFEIFINLISEFQTITSKFLFVNSTLAPNGWSGINVTANGSYLNQITALYNSAVARYAAYSYITVIQNPDGISIQITLDNVTSSTLGTTSSDPDTFTITHTNIVIPDPPEQSKTILLSRSPQFIEVSPSGFFDQVFMDLRIYRGHEVDDYPLVPAFSFSKTVVQAGQERLVFDISSVVNGYVKANIGLFGDGAQTSSSLESVWVKADVDIYFLGELIGNVQKGYLAVDGFGYHTELYNPVISQKVLSSIDRHIVYTGTDYPLYFQTHNLTSITVNNQDVPFTFDPLYNNQSVAYVNVMTYADTASAFTAEFVYGSGEETEVVKQFFTVKTECRFEVQNLFFKNKFGYWQCIGFPKQWKKEQNFTSSDYNPTISEYGQYALNQHTKKTFLLEGREKININTDFLPEHYNLLFTEMMLSELVYLATDAGILPVNKETMKFSKKTKLVDKLIQYGLTFEYSFNIMNTVR